MSKFDIANAINEESSDTSESPVRTKLHKKAKISRSKST